MHLEVLCEMLASRCNYDLGLREVKVLSHAHTAVAVQLTTNSHISPPKNIWQLPSAQTHIP